MYYLKVNLLRIIYWIDTVQHSYKIIDSLKKGTFFLRSGEKYVQKDVICYYYEATKKKRITVNHSILLKNKITNRTYKKLINQCFSEPRLYNLAIVSLYPFGLNALF